MVYSMLPRTSDHASSLSSDVFACDLRYGKPQLNLALGLGDQITWQLLQLRRKLSFKVSFSIVFASTFRNIRFNVGIDNYPMNWTFRQLELIVDPFQVVPSLTRPIFFS